MANEESLLGLLLRAHEECSGQKHGEKYLHHNANAANSYGIAVKHIYDAINAVVIAEMYVMKQDTREAVKKEMTPNGK